MIHRIRSLKNKLKERKAFSLVELSLVILIIGIVITGILSSGLLISKYRSFAAQNFTQNSPLSSMEDMSFWLETTSQNSFLEVEAQNNSTISIWKDIKISPKTKYDATSSGTAKPTYKTDCINSLPCLSFDGVDDYINVEDFATALTSFTFIAVINVPESGGSDWRNFFATITDDATSDGQIRLTLNPSDNLLFHLNYAGNASNKGGALNYGTKTSPYLVTMYEKTGDKILVRINGTQKLSSTDVTNNGLKVISGLGIGNDNGSDFLYGDIGEVVFFNRYLTETERGEIEEYLAKKWQIDLS